MQSRLLFSITFIIFLAIGTYPVTAFALTVSNPSITIDCTQVCINTGTTLTTDRDNTGAGQESNGFSVEDGIGTHLAGDGGNTPVGNVYTYPAPQCYSYYTNPQYNPIIFRFISAAGNGYPQQIAYTTSGTCNGLPLATTSIPTMTQWGMLLFVFLAGVGAVVYLRRQKIMEK
jgi:hypothetical protein